MQLICSREVPPDDIQGPEGGVDRLTAEDLSVV